MTADEAINRATKFVLEYNQGEPYLTFESVHFTQPGSVEERPCWTVVFRHDEPGEGVEFITSGNNAFVKVDDLSGDASFW